MNHSVTDHDNAIVVAFTGDVDLETSPSAREVLLGLVGGGRAILIDLSGVDYIDSSGVASLVESLQGARKAGCEFALAAISEPALRVLHLARLDTVFTIHESREAALAELG